MSATPANLLAASRMLLDAPASGTSAAWPRASALLARQALEAAIDVFWQRRAPGVDVVTSMRAKLICLPAYADDPELAASVVFAWNGLSRAVHAHPYELEPTRAELAALIEVVERWFGHLVGR